MKYICKKHPKANSKRFIDDTSMFAAALEQGDVLDILIPAMIDFQRRVHNLKLKLSPKAVIVTNKTKFTQWIINELKT